MSKKPNNSYRNILKGNTLFGGVQLFQILVGLLRGKFVAIFLGPEGMGIMSLFNSTAETLRKVSSLGVNLAIVKETGGAADDPERLRHIVVAVRRIVAITAVIGLLATLSLSSVLGRFTFGNDSQYYGMLLLAPVVFLTVCWQGDMSVLQGLHRVKSISKATIIGSLTGLLAGVPLYWLFGYRGIVPAMLVFAAVMAAVYSYSVRKTVGTRGVKFLWSEHGAIVKRLVALGLILMVSDCINTGVLYLTNIYVRSAGTLDDVGFWQGANSLTNQYAGVIFTALAMDYLPRLMGAVKERQQFRDIVDRQTEIISLLVAPLASLLILFAPLVVRVLLTEQYLEIVPLLRILAVALALRAAMYPLGYITLAMDNKKVFFWMEAVWCNFQTLVMGVGGYWLFGLYGLGYGLAADCLLCLVLYIAVNRRLYGYFYSRRALRTVIVSLLLTSAAYASSLAPGDYVSYALMTAVTLLSAAMAWRGVRFRLRKKDE